MRTILGKLFSKSPFEPLKKHIEKVKECLDELKPLFNEFEKSNFDEVKKIAKKIWELERQADEFKNEIRNHLPKNILLPVARSDFIEMIEQQDLIANSIEDIAALLTMRKTLFPPELKERFYQFLDSVINTVEQIINIIKNIDSLLNASFSGEQAQEVLNKINKLNYLEYESDKHQYKLAKKLFEIEDKMSPINCYMLISIFKALGQLADNAQKTGDKLRLMLKL